MSENCMKNIWVVKEKQTHVFLMHFSLHVRTKIHGKFHLVFTQCTVMHHIFQVHFHSLSTDNWFLFFMSVLCNPSWLDGLTCDMIRDIITCIFYLLSFIVYIIHTYTHNVPCHRSPHWHSLSERCADSDWVRSRESLTQKSLNTADLSLKSDCLKLQVASRFKEIRVLYNPLESLLWKTVSLNESYMYIFYIICYIRVEVEVAVVVVVD